MLARQTARRSGICKDGIERDTKETRETTMGTRPLGL